MALESSAYLFEIAATQSKSDWLLITQRRVLQVDLLILESNME